MRIISHGIDIASIAGIKEQVDSLNKRWTERFCSDDERAEADDPPVHYRYYAGRFAGKEAVAKALGQVSQVTSRGGGSRFSIVRAGGRTSV